MTTFDGVIFDLFGTLVDGAPPAVYEQALEEMIAALGVPRDGFLQFWRQTADDRGLGKYQTIEANIQDACHTLGVPLDPECLRVAMLARMALARATWKLKPDTVQTLTELEERGCKLGLLSNCSADYACLWEEMPLATFIEQPVFSCTVGLKKPDPRIYQLALERVGLHASRCLYVGDGESQELTGATNAGLHAVRISWPGDEARDPYREPWPRVISALGEVPALLG